MNRRSFMAVILAAGIAPAFVRKLSMPIFVRHESGLFVPGPAGNYFATPEPLWLDHDPIVASIDGWVKLVIHRDSGKKSYFMSHQSINTALEQIVWEPAVKKPYGIEIRDGIFQNID